MKELFAKHKEKIIKFALGAIFAAVSALFGYKLSDVMPTEKTQELINKNVPPVLAPTEVPKVEEKK